MAFVIPLLLVPWISIVSRFENWPADMMVFVLSVGLVLTSLASAIQTPAAAWAGLPAIALIQQVPGVCRKLRRRSNWKPSNKSPVDVMVLANHTVINYQQCELNCLRRSSLRARHRQYFEGCVLYATRKGSVAPGRSSCDPFTGQVRPGRALGKLDFRARRLNSTRRLNAGALDSELSPCGPLHYDCQTALN